VSTASEVTKAQSPTSKFRQTQPCDDQVREPLEGGSFSSSHFPQLDFGAMTNDNVSAPITKISSVKSGIRYYCGT
jgi:hypothetical protein